MQTPFSMLILGQRRAVDAVAKRLDGARDVSARSALPGRHASEVSNVRLASKLLRARTPRAPSRPSRFHPDVVSYSTVLVIMLCGFCFTAQAYPEFQTFVVKNSNRPINCAMCHSHADGPEGTAPGQIGRLNAEEQDRLGRARAAFLPGQNVDSPILNPFGNSIIKALGKQKFLELKLAPEQLAEALPKESDLDQDGIPDAREYLEGTHPVNRNDGNPWLLFKWNFRKHFSQIVLTLAATVGGLWGLAHLLSGFASATQLKQQEEET